MCRRACGAAPGLGLLCAAALGNRAPPGQDLGGAALGLVPRQTLSAEPPGCHQALPREAECPSSSLPCLVPYRAQTGGCCTLPWS